jgi:hypothetical protein
MSDNAEIFDFLRTRFARLEERLDRVDTRLEKRLVDFAAMHDRLNNFECRLARIEPWLAVAQSEPERAIRDSEQLLNLLEVPERHCACLSGMKRHKNTTANLLAGQDAQVKATHNGSPFPDQRPKTAISSDAFVRDAT